MSYELVIRALAVVAAFAIVAGPRLVAAAQRVRLPATGGQSAELKDSYAVLEIASRLKAAGNKRAVELCKQLLDAMLMEPKS